MNIEGNENELVTANNYVTDEQISRKRRNVIEDVPTIFFAKVGALPSYNASDVDGIEISLPKRSEQEALGTYFRHLAHLITLHQRKCEELRNLKKFMLQNMFS